ncbi:hypothetical protein [uncultured Cetobacterium sp.]|uniref:hypothetical protein n=1 Tax=uncultured Cetobacterium sp. TaxID=527638 RepID=UPI002617DCB3|nr:hypothetical protein [uncultured Cetobacterium sp.]
MKSKLLILVVLIYFKSYAEIILKIHEPMRFENINTRAAGDVIVGEGSIEVISDNLEVDRDKKFILKFPKKGLMTNNKRWIEIDKYMIEDSDRVFRLTKEKKLIKIYAIIDRKKLNNQWIKAEDLEGEYIGYVPIIVEQYGKPMKKID